MAAFKANENLAPQEIEKDVFGNGEPKKMQKVNVAIYGTGDKSRNSADIVYCAASDCSLRDEGRCMQHRRLFGGSDVCRLGYVKTVEGYTKRAASYYDFCRFFREDECYGALEGDGGFILAKMDSWFCLNLNYMELVENDGKWRLDAARLVATPPSWIPEDELTSALVTNIVEAKPRNVFGDVVSSWKKDSVPQLMEALRELAPDVWEEVVKDSPELANVVRDNVGRRAYVATVFEKRKIGRKEDSK